MKRKKILVLIILLLFLNTFVCFANSAGPPSIVIITDDAPDDLVVSFIINDEYVVAKKYHKINETYFVVEEYSIEPWKQNRVMFSTKGESFYFDLKGKLKSYNNVFTLNYENRTLSQGKTFKRSLVLVMLRVALTLLIEGSIFFLFKYREKRSWKVFLITNLITQGLLNIWINTASPVENSYSVLIYLIFAEVFILLFEMLFLTIFIKEKKWFITAAYVVVANAVSLVLGAIIIPLVPV